MKKLIVILGMHRSGTSLMTQMIQGMDPIWEKKIICWKRIQVIRMGILDTWKYFMPILFYESFLFEGRTKCFSK